MDYSEIIDKVSGDIGISPDIVDKAYKAFWKYIRNSIEELTLKEEYTKEEFLKLKTNFNIPSLGKLACTYNRYLGVKSRFNYIKALKSRYNNIGEKEDKEIGSRTKNKNKHLGEDEEVN